MKKLFIILISIFLISGVVYATETTVTSKYISDTLTGIFDFSGATVTLGSASSTQLTASGNIWAGGFIGNVTGNTDTATALAVNPSACAGGQVVSDIAANGTLTCVATSTNANTASALLADPADCAAGSFANAIAASGALTCAATSTFYTFDGTTACATGAVCTGGHNHDIAGLAWANDWMIAYSDTTGLQELAIGTTGTYLKSNGEAAPTWVNPLTYASSTALTVSGTSYLAATIVSGALSFSGTGNIQLPNGASGFTNTAGNTFFDSTTGQFRFNDGTATRTIPSLIQASFTYATSTAWTGTTTIPLGVAVQAETWVGAYCYTDIGTLDLSFYDGTNRMNIYKSASTTVDTPLTFSTNNTFIAKEIRKVDIGNPATSPLKISCTITKRIDPD